MSSVKGIAILGSTGTIGRNTVDVLDRYPDRYRIVALTANRNVNGMFEQCVKYSPRIAVMRDENAAPHSPMSVTIFCSFASVSAGRYMRASPGWFVLPRWTKAIS